MMVMDFMHTVSHTQLANGLRIHLAPRPEFHQMVAMLSVNYGARDQRFRYQGTDYQQPAGVAHFLEHKIFTQKGYDAFTRISELGANGNAFTTQSRTSYFISTTGQSYEALRELLTFTQQPFFEAAAVAREAEIISQEVDMYQDDVGARLYRVLLKQLFPGEPLADDIAGTRASVRAIKPADLQLAFDAFYQPANMDVFITGNFDTTAILDLINDSPAGVRQSGAVAQVLYPNDATIRHELAEVDVPTVRNKIAMGQRFFGRETLPQGVDALRQVIALSMVTDLVFGDYSPDYMLWYDEGLIDESFTTEFDWERGFAFLSVAAETAEPEELVTAVSAKLANLPSEFIALRSKFELVKKDAMGRLVNKLNNLEEIVTRFEGATFAYTTLVDEIDILRTLDFDEVLAIVKNAQVTPITSIIARPKMV